MRHTRPSTPNEIGNAPLTAWLVVCAASRTRSTASTVRPDSALLAWHVPIALGAWQVPAGRVLSGSDSWNGKALVVPLSKSIERSVGEVEIAERLRIAYPDASAYWTAGSGNPPEIWRPWALRATLRDSWFRDFERDVRQGVAAIEANDRGTPDVLWWRTGRSDLHAVEYKGPSPSNPGRMDGFSEWQEAWLASAIARGLLDQDRYAVAYWQPSATDRARLTDQAASSRLGRERKRAGITPT
jgi:hypothetical protein